MSFSTKSPTIKRILQESKELLTNPSPDFSAAPLESNLFEWHFTLRGPPSSPYTGGLYHGRIVLPPSYPLRPPSFRFLTPSGRFEVNREICLSISGFHEETWQPAWGIRTALLAIRGFMDSEAGGAVGSMDADEGVKRRLAERSGSWACRDCGRTNRETIMELEREIAERGEQAAKKEEETVPKELRLGYRDQLGEGTKEEKVTDKGTEQATLSSSEKQLEAQDSQEQVLPNVRTPRAVPAEMPIRRPPRDVVARAVNIQSAQAGTQVRPRNVEAAWLDKAIVGVAGALAFMIFRFLFL